MPFRPLTSNQNQQAQSAPGFRPINAPTILSNIDRIVSNIPKREDFADQASYNAAHNEYRQKGSQALGQALPENVQTPSTKASSYFVKELPKAAVKTVVQGPVKLAVSGAEGVSQTIKTGGKENASGKTYHIPVIGDVKSFQSEADERAKQGQNPLLNVLEGSIDVVSAGADTAGLAEGGNKLIKTGVKLLAEKAEKSAAKDVLEVIKPNLTPTEEAAAKSAGRAKTSGIMKNVTIEPTSRELETAKIAQQAGVKSSNTFSENINLMKQTQHTSAQEVRQGLENSDAIWNKNELKSRLNKVELPITVKSDATLSKTAENFNKAVLELSEKADKKAVGLLDVRQQLDDLISNEFPSNIYTKDTPMGQYIRKVRSTLNDFAESKLPDGQLPSGSTLKAELRKQHLLYDAIDNVAEKAPKEGESARPIVQKVKNIVKKHPIITGAAGALGIERVAKKLGVPLP